MGSKMVLLPETPTVLKIYDLYKNDKPRGYLGASEIGDECMRKLWYSFRQVAQQDFDGRILRLFDTGKREEIRILEELKRIGLEIEGTQWSASECDGHLSGHVDGIVKGLSEAPETWHVLEIKTHNKKSYDELDKNGVEKSKYKHYCQMQIYMGLSELDRAVYIAVCKDDDRIYLERVKFNQTIYKSLLLKANRVIKSPYPLEKISEDPSYYICKMCSYVDMCHRGIEADKNCYTCMWSEPIKEGKWSCKKEKEFKLCDEYIMIAGLCEVPF